MSNQNCFRLVPPVSCGGGLALYLPRDSRFSRFLFPLTSDNIERTQGMSISIGAGYDLPEEKHRVTNNQEGSGGGHDSERMAVVDDLNDKLQVS